MLDLPTNCEIIKVQMSRRKTIEEFVHQSQMKYGNKFDYSNTVYVKNDARVIIRCVLHDLIFEQTPSNHLIFNGCPNCLIESQQLRFRKTTDQFIKEARVADFECPVFYTFLHIAA